MIMELGLRAHDEIAQQLLPVLREIGESALELFRSAAEQKSVSGKPTKSFVGSLLCGCVVAEVALLEYDVTTAVMATFEGHSEKTDDGNQLPVTSK